MKYMPARPVPSPESSVNSLLLKGRPFVEVTLDAGPADDDISSEADETFTPRTEEGDPHRHTRTSRSISSPHGNKTQDPSQHSHLGHDPMDYRMHDVPSTVYCPSPHAGHMSPASHRLSTPSSQKQELGGLPPSPGQSVKLHEILEPQPTNTVVVEPPLLDQLQAPLHEISMSPVADRKPAQEQAGWNFVLPDIPGPTSLTPGLAGSSVFNVAALVGALQQGVDEQAVQTHFNHFDPMVIEQHINDLVAGIPAIFYAAATNNDRILRAFIALGADVNAVYEPSQVPLLAFVIAHSETIERDTSHIVATLLSMGATPRAIPEAFYVPYLRDLAEEGPLDEELKEVATSTMRWLKKDARAKLARTTHLTNRYNLERAMKTKPPSTRQWQIAQRRNAMELLGLPYFLIGQSLAAQHVLTELLNTLAVPSKRPLVLVFAGPSGHGKTEMARRLGYLMNLELLVVDCTSVQRETDLFGGRHPYVNAAKGTQLNNHLVKYHRQRSIVFLDEFEKTSPEVHQALLLPFDNGKPQRMGGLCKYWSV